MAVGRFGDLVMKCIGAVIARTASTRLPCKVLKEVHGQTMVEHIIDRVAVVLGTDKTYVATSAEAADDDLASIAKEKKIKVYRGSSEKVIERLLAIAELENAEYVVRITGDNIFTDSRLLSILVEEVREKRVDYARVEGAPLGVTAELIRVDALKDCLSRVDPRLTEYLMLFMFDPSRYSVLVIDVSSWVPPLTTLTVDTKEDWRRTEFIFDNYQSSCQPSLSEVLEIDRLKRIPHFYIEENALVSLPEGKRQRMIDFMNELQRRRQLSKFNIKLSKHEYESIQIC